MKKLFPAPVMPTTAMCGLAIFMKDQLNGILNMLVLPMYIASKGLLISTLAGGSGGLERKALLATSLLIMLWNFSCVIETTQILNFYNYPSTLNSLAISS